MLHLFISILGILITIICVVGIHEFGHFITARLMGVKVLQFSIGFGKKLYQWKDKKGTEYTIAAIPVGGFVKMLDEQEGDVPESDLPYAYNNQPFYKKFAIVSAGPIANLIFAFIIYWIIFMIGFVGVIPLIGKIKPDSIAYIAGMKPNQEIVKVDNEPTLSWIGVIINTLIRAGDKDNLTITTRDLHSHQTNVYTLSLAQWHLNELKPDPLDSLGIIPYEPEIPAVIKTIQADSPAYSLLQTQDKILAVNNIPIKDWFDLSEQINKHADTIINLKVLRQNKIIFLPIKTNYERDWLLPKRGYLGISPDFKWPTYMLRNNQYGPIGAFTHAWQDTKVFIAMNFVIFGKLLTGKVSLASLGGPITIFQTAGTAINHGILPFLSFLAFLSIAIGLVNVLPIPGLDGGHALFQVIELIIRRPIPMNVQLLAYRLGLILLFLLLTQAIVNDILRL